jgi:quercetin dioxygenase-like cupin family protein
MLAHGSSMSEQPSPARAESTAPGEPRAPRYPVVQAAADAPIIPGRREWVQYRDLGLTAASAGALSMHTTDVDIPMARETGWHYHTCEFQIVWVNAGWLELQFEDGTTRRAEAGSVVFIPGGVGHNETATSNKLSILELFIPPDPQTVPIDVPAAWQSDGRDDTARC